MSAPTLVGTSGSIWTGQASADEVTAASLSWQAGDLIVVTGATEDQGTTLDVPTVTGLTFAQLGTVNVAGACRAYVWTATAGGSGSGQITAQVFGVIGMRGIRAYVWRDHGGIGETYFSSANESVSVHSLALAQNSGAMFALGDWTANGDTTVAAVPTSTGVQDEAATIADTVATLFAFHWTDISGTQDVGISGFAGTAGGKCIMAIVEILGTGAPPLEATPSEPTPSISVF